MSIIFHQSKVSLKLFKEKDEKIILGEILHFVYETFLTELSSFITRSEEDLLSLFQNLLKKALAYYQEPLPQRKKIFDSAFSLLKEHIFSKDFQFLQQLCQDSEPFPEVSIFEKTATEVCEFRPDLILKKKKNLFLFEFKLHEEKGKQIEKYVSLLQKLFPDATIKAYLVYFEPFKIEKKGEWKLRINLSEGSSYESLPHPTQLQLFKNFG